MLAPPVSSPCLDVNEGIDLLATGSSGCLSSQSCQTNQMWKNELSELLVAKGYWKVVGAKLLHVVDVTFCSIPTDDANFCYLDRLTFGASAVQCKCWTNGFEHNKLAIFELKLQWVPQTFFGGLTWECVLLHEEMNIIY